MLDASRQCVVTPGNALLVTPESLGRYLRDDWVMCMLQSQRAPASSLSVSQQWLLSQPSKRHVFACMYGDLLDENGQRLLDVGGGVSSFSEVLARGNHYELVEILAHDHGDRVTTQKNLSGVDLHCMDWKELERDSTWDVVVANDLFPNVDQRLELFCQTFLPRCRQLRLSLTYFNVPRYYKTKRIDADEIMWVLAWDGWQLQRALQPFLSRLHISIPSLSDVESESIFKNGRLVLIVNLQGDLF